MDKIKFDFALANRRADEIERLAGQLRELAEGELFKELNGLSLHWSGESYDEYRKKGNEVINQIVSMSKNLLLSASDIRNVAREMHMAEMNALQMANERLS